MYARLVRITVADLDTSLIGTEMMVGTSAAGTLSDISESRRGRRTLYIGGQVLTVTNTTQVTYDTLTRTR